MQPVEVASISLVLVAFGAAAVVASPRRDRIGWWIWGWGILVLAGLLLLLGSSSTPLRAGGGFLAVLFPGMQLAGAFEYADRSVPRWLIPGFVGLGLLRIGVAGAGFEMHSHLAVVPFELAALFGAAGVVLRTRPEQTPTPIEWLLVFGFAVIGVAEGLDAVLDLRGTGNGVAWSVWLCIGVPVGACQIVATFDRMEGQLARSLADRERALLDLEESNERFRAIAQEADDVIVESDSAHGIRYVNPRFSEVLGYAPEQVLGRRVVDFAWDRDSFPTRRELAGRRRRLFGPVEIRHRDGSSRSFESSTRSYVRDGVHHIVIIARDVTDRLRDDEERRKAQKLESLGLVAGGVAHDFNNLLTGILGNAELALAELPMEHSARDLVQQVLESSGQAAQLTRQLQAYSGASPFEIRPTDVSDEIRSNAELLGTAIGEDTTLDLDLEEGLPLVDADPGLLLQVVLNLVLNGAEACRGTGGSVRIRTGVTRIEPSQPAPASGSLTFGECVFVQVEDTGRGIDESIRDRLFDPFFTTNERGRGLGLAVVHGVVQTLRAAMTIDSSAGQGSCFRLLLPTSSGDARPPQAVELGKIDGDESILVIDDDQSVLKVICESLQQHGYRVSTASDRAGARQRMQDAMGPLDLVLLDAVMPGEPGEQVLEDLRALRPGVPVILISGFAEIEAMRRFARYDEVEGFIAKPFRLHELAARVRHAIDRSPGDGTSRNAR